MMARKLAGALRFRGRDPVAGASRSADEEGGDEQDAARRIAAHLAIVKKELGPATRSMSTWVTLADLHDMILHLCHGDMAVVERLIGPREPLDDSIIAYNQGFEAYRDGDMNAAATSFARAIEMVPWNALARFTLASVRFLEGDVKAALAILGELLAMVESVARSEVLTNMGMCAFKLDRLDAARTSFQEAVAIDPANAFAWHDLAALEDVAGNVDAARDAYVKALAINREDAETWYNLGALLGKQGLKAERLHCFIKAEEQGFPELREMIEDLLAQGVEPRAPAGVQAAR